MWKLAPWTRRITSSAWRKLTNTGFSLNPLRIVADQWRWLVVTGFMLLPLPIVIWIHQAHGNGAPTPVDLATDYLKAVGILLVLSGLFVAGSWLVRKRSGYAMLPFLNATGVGARRDPGAQ